MARRRHRQRLNLSPVQRRIRKRRKAKRSNGLFTRPYPGRLDRDGLG